MLGADVNNHWSPHRYNLDGVVFASERPITTPMEPPPVKRGPAALEHRGIDF